MILTQQERLDVMTRPQKTVDTYMVETMNHIEAALKTIAEMREQHNNRSPKLETVETELYRAYDRTQARRPLLGPVPNAITRGELDDGTDNRRGF